MGNTSQLQFFLLKNSRNILAHSIKLLSLCLPQLLLYSWIVVFVHIQRKPWDLPRLNRFFESKTIGTNERPSKMTFINCIDQSQGLKSAKYFVTCIFSFGNLSYIIMLTYSEDAYSKPQTPHTNCSLYSSRALHYNSLLNHLVSINNSCFQNKFLIIPDSFAELSSLPLLHSFLSDFSSSSGLEKYVN